MRTLTLSDFEYELPESQIAQTPIEQRDHSKLLVVDRVTGKLSHHHFFELPTLLHPTDVLVINNSKTVPMRTYGTKKTGGKIEVLFVKRVSYEKEGEVWEVLSSPGLKVGQEVEYPNEMHLMCIENLGYTHKVLLKPINGTVVEVLHRIGELPTPHYIHKHLSNPERYQTIYAKPEGSAATPTAGLHFTQSIFEALNKKGIQIIELTLHVGLGTFLPVKTQNITDHIMHKEWFTLTPENAQKLNQWKAQGRRIVSVGTTTTRVLESCTRWNEGSQQFELVAQTGETQAFFYPPYSFKFVDALITNFHLPKSTLLMLISAFCSQGKTFATFKDSLAGKAYVEAIKKKYRFYSFGDAMIIS